MPQYFFLLTLARKAGGRCGFAESVPEERITALKVDETAVEMTDVMDGANDIAQKTEAPLQKYPFVTRLEPPKGTQQRKGLTCISQNAPQISTAARWLGTWKTEKDQV